MECGLVGKGEFVGSHGQAPPLFESGDAAFDGVAFFVCLAVEARRAASGTASPEAVTDLVGGLRDDSSDAAPAEMRGSRGRSTPGRRGRVPVESLVSQVPFVEPGFWP